MLNDPPHAMTRDEMRHAPTSIARRDTWIWWRRLMDRPPPAARQRMAAWFRLDHMLASLEKSRVPALPGVRKPGIFYKSIVYADFLDAFGDAPFTLGGLVLQGTSCRSARLACPVGKFATQRSIPQFQFDITDVDAIGHSQRDSLHFPSVRAFGLDYLTFRRESIDTAALIRMLDHREVRIVGRSPTDAVGVRLWDGRLFLQNSGGSHHFAGAAYISEMTGQPVTLDARLNVIELHEPTIRWLLDEFVIYIAPKKTAVTFIRVAAQILGRCYGHDVPGVISPDSTFVFLPKAAGACNELIAVCQRAGLVDVAPWLESLLSAQRQNRTMLARRFPLMFGNATATAGGAPQPSSMPA